MAIITYHYKYASYLNNKKATLLCKWVAGNQLFLLLYLLLSLLLVGGLYEFIREPLGNMMGSDVGFAVTNILCLILTAALVLLFIRRSKITEKLAAKMQEKQAGKLKTLLAPSGSAGTGCYVYDMPWDRDVTSRYVSDAKRAGSPDTARSVFLLYHEKVDEKIFTRLAMIEKGSGRTLYDSRVVYGERKWIESFPGKISDNERKVTDLIEALTR